MKNLIHSGIFLLNVSALALIAFLARSEAMAQAPGETDLSLNAGSSLDGDVFAILQRADDKWIVGGNFSGGVARLHEDGEIDHSFMERKAGPNRTVSAAALQSDSKILIGGLFTEIQGVTRNRIARLNPDGDLDHTFGEELAGVDGPVRAIVLDEEGKILIGGNFNEVNGKLRRNIARLNPDGTLDTTFTSSLSGQENFISSIVLLPDRKILIGGKFSMIGGHIRNSIARLNPDGSLDTTFGEGLQGVDGRFVEAIVVQDDGRILIGGDFEAVNGEEKYALARLNQDGTSDIEFPQAIFSDVDHVAAIELQGDSKILVGGDIWPNITRLNMDGTMDESFAIVKTSGETVRAITVASDGSVLIGGDIDWVNDEARSGIARLHSDGTLASNFGLTGPNRSVSSLAVQPDGAIIIGGTFTAIRGEVRNGIARLNPDGSLDSAFGEGLAGASGWVLALALQQDGRILIGGTFTEVNGEIRNGLARLNPDGTLDRTFLSNGVGSRPSGIGSIALQSDGRILIGGAFDNVDGIPRGGIARLNPDGTLDETFGNEFSGVGGPSWAAVDSIALQADGKILIGGIFTTVNGIARNRIARLNPDGSLDASFGHGLRGVEGTSSADVYAIAVQSDGKIVVGGIFFLVNGIVRNNIARLNPDGSLDRTFGEGLAGVGWRDVASILMQNDGKILIGGNFQTVNGEPRSNVARLNQDGSLDGGFGEQLPGVAGNGRTAVAAMAWDCEGTFLIGGAFTWANWTRRDRVARLYADAPSVEAGFQAWAQSLPPCQRGENDDPGGFGVPNLLRYAFGMSPAEPERAKLPRLGYHTVVENSETQAHLKLTYHRRTDDSSLAFTAEYSDDLKTWLPLEGTVKSTDTGETQTEEITVIDSESTATFQRRFLRIHVAH